MIIPVFCYFYLYFFGQAMRHVESSPGQGLTLCRLQWKGSVLTTGQPGESSRLPLVMPQPVLATPTPPPLGRRPAHLPRKLGGHLWGRRLRRAQSESCPPGAQAASEGKRSPLCQALVSLPCTAGPQCYPLGDAKRITAESCPQGGSGNQRK